MKVEEFFCKHQGGRRLVVLFTLGLTATVTYMSWRFAMVSKFDGMGTAAIIAAITAPTAWIQKAAFSDYMNSKERGD